MAIVRIAFATRPPFPISSAEVVAPDGHLDDEIAVLLDLRHLDGVGILDQRPGEELDQVAHQAPDGLDPLRSQKTRDRAGRLRAMGEPVASPVLVDHDRRRIGLRVVVTDRLDDPPVPRGPAVGDDDAPIRVLASNPTLVSLILTAICGGQVSCCAEKPATRIAAYP